MKPFSPSAINQDTVSR